MSTYSIYIGTSNEYLQYIQGHFKYIYKFFTLTTLWTYTADDIMIFSSCSHKIGSDVTCTLSPQEMSKAIFWEK